MSERVDLIERDRELNVVVFDSANPDFYLAHYDTEHASLDLLVRFSRAPAGTPLQWKGESYGGPRDVAVIRPGEPSTGTGRCASAGLLMRGVGRGVHPLSPSVLFGVGWGDRRSFERELAEVGLGDLEDLIAPTGEDAAGGPERESLGLLHGDLGRDRQLLTDGHDLDDRRPVVREG